MNTQDTRTITPPSEVALARHIARTGFADLPADAVAAAKKSILDSLGIMLATTTTSQDARILVDMVRDAGGAEEATVLGFGFKVPAAAAAFANGALGHPLDFDDAHETSLTHPASAVLPAALAAAEITPGTTGRDLLTAVVVATDLVCRIGLAIDASAAKHGWMTSVSCGYFGAVAAAGKIMGLSEAQLLDAFGIALCQVGGSREMGQGESGVRGIRDAFTQQVGMSAVLLAKRGLHGPHSFLEGKHGFFNQYFGGQYTPARLTRDLGQVFEGASVSYKAWPCCRLAHTYIGSLLNLMDEHALKADDIREVRAVVSGFSRGLCEPLDRRRAPDTPIYAKYSIPFALGVALARRDVGIADFEPDQLGEASVLRASAKVNYVLDETIPDDGFSPGDIEVVLQDGRRLSRVETHALGSPQNPMTEQDLIAKFRKCVAHSVTPMSGAAVDALIGFVLDLENASSLGPLFGRAGQQGG